MFEILFATFLISSQPRVDFKADTSNYVIDSRRMELIGNVSVIRAGTTTESELTLKADTISGKIDGLITAEGAVQIEYSGRTATASHGIYDIAIGEGRFDDVKFVEDSWFVRAKVMQALGTERFELSDVTATSCDKEPPHYHFKLNRASYDGTHLKLSGATMYIGKTPVFWWPYLSLRPAGGKPPFRIRAGKSDYEGYFVKTAYRIISTDAADAEVILDWRSRRGWAYGALGSIALKRGNLDFDLYRIDERDRGGRGVARAQYRQELLERLTSRADIYFVTDGLFLQDYRFEDFASKPDPISRASLSWRGDGAAGVLRVAVNQRRDDYDLIERLPELRWNYSPHPIFEKVFLEAKGGFTVFRISNPYDSGIASLSKRDNPSAGDDVGLTRGDAEIRVRRKFELGKGFAFTPEARISAIGYLNDTGAIPEPYRVMPSAGFALTNYRRFNLSNDVSYSIRPGLEFLERGLGWNRGDAYSIIEHIDRERDARTLKIILDQGMMTRNGRTWKEKLRVRLDGGFDFDRNGAERYLPIVGKISVWPIQNSSLDIGVTYLPNGIGLRDAWTSFSYSRPGVTISSGYNYRRGDAGLKDYENASLGALTRFAKVWEFGLNASYNLTEQRMDFASYNLTREFHDWIIGFRITDQKAVNRWDFRVSAEMKFP
ncbi:MAG: hypothetical protein COS94_00905 [Candidatus Hydrogenedentes bacterium CG07_land_8_20_14_0_80_42_17]|nr:MAG: hypothetical protein COS94_00905 [Candidatus Hydrogenedentes bacterium CG07_land_8_20_14_0_80_42_17]